jgi:hypothetical protein
LIAADVNEAEGEFWDAVSTTMVYGHGKPSYIVSADVEFTSLSFLVGSPW